MILSLNFDALPIRLNIGIMAFFVCFISYILRANMSINILAMTNSTENDTNMLVNSTRYDWTDAQQKLLPGAFFWGQFVSTIPSGFLAEQYGGKRIVMIALLVSTIFTALTPIMCELGFWAVYVNRIIIGLVGGVFFPALHNLLSKWVPPDEKSKFVSALLGGNLGTVFVWQASGLLITMFGWEFAFYAVAALTLSIVLAWIFLISDTPRTHPRISNKEIQYIEQSLAGNVSQEKAIPPYFAIVKSIPFWALAILHYGNLWGLFFLLNTAPLYMKHALKFDLKTTGLLSSLPHLSRFLVGFIFGLIGDIFRRNNCMSPSMMRKVFCIFSHVIPGLLLISLTYEGIDPYMCVFIMTASLGSNGAATLTNLQNSQDLAPNFAGTIYALINTLATSSGFISPSVVNYFTTNDNSPDSWNTVFLIGSIFYILPVIFFWIFGTAEVQPWNEVHTKKKMDAV